jgi:cephalosporin-C deacetylase
MIQHSIEFESYWARVRAEVNAAPADWERTSQPLLIGSRGNRWMIDWIRFSSVGDHVIEGWLSVPHDHPVSGAGFLWLPGYSYGTPPPDDSNLIAGACTFAINVHGNPPNFPYVNPAGKNDYILNGIDLPETYIYRAIIIHCLKALPVLLEQEEITRGIGVGGMSQGGGLALIVAAQSPSPKICCAAMPFLADIEQSLAVSRSPAYRALAHHIAKKPEALQTILLFDALYHAQSISVPTWLSAGGKDPACKPVTVEAVFREIASPVKHYEFFPNVGHNFTPEMNAMYQRMIEKNVLR